MIITTIDLLNYLRCRRYAALDTRMQARQNNGILIDDKFSSLKYLSVKNNYQSIIDEEDPGEIVQKKQLHHEVTAKAVTAIKAVTLSKIQALNPDMLVSQNQKVSGEFGPDFTLSIRLDFLATYSDNLSCFTVFPATDRDLVNWKYNLGKEKMSFFAKNEQGIFSHEKKHFSPTPKSNYDERLEKMTDRRNDTGRFLYDLAYKTYVLKRLYPDQTIRTFLVLLNGRFVHDGVSGNGPGLVSIFDLTAIVSTMTPMIEVDLYRMMNHINLNDDSPCPLVKNECQKGTSFECQFADYCFGHIPKINSIFSYFQSYLGFSEGPSKTDECHDPYDLVNNGMVDLLDVPISWLQREKNLMQRYCVENDYTFINKPKVKAILETLRYPIYYLDFEAFPSILPRFRGESPYTQSVFQFSIHMEKKVGTLDDKNDPRTHFEYLASTDRDPREELIQKLLEAIPEGNSSVIVYNKTFEKNRLVELATIFPNYGKRLLGIADRLFDLMRVLKNDFDFYASLGFPKENADSYNFYHPLMSGSYSLKKVLPVFEAEGYDSLPISNGMAAYLQFARIPEMEAHEGRETRINLLAYCQQDTWSMRTILHGLQNML